MGKAMIELISLAEESIRNFPIVYYSPDLGFHSLAYISKVDKAAQIKL